MLSRPTYVEDHLAQNLHRLSTADVWLAAVMHELDAVVVGLEDLKETIILGLLADGHVLIEGNPGLAKTLTAKTLGTILGLDFARIQATPDLTPADILGTSEVRGPVFTQILLVDEINRMQSRTQSALLEAMEERQVSVKGRPVKLPEPFLVLATQNPIESEGTYPLPEAQLDRFLFKIRVDYPDLHDLRDIMARSAGMPEMDILSSAAHLRVWQRAVRECPMPDEVSDYIGRLILATHPESPHAAPLTRRYVLYGASPRGALSLMRGAKARTVLRGRETIEIDDVRALLVRSLQHRINLNFEGVASGIAPQDILDDVWRHTAEASLTRRAACD
jgi:MoxR-like ATPase